MKSIHLLKFIIYSVGFLTVASNIIESIYIALFNRPILVHLYFIKKKLSKQKKEFLENNIAFYKNLNDDYKVYFEHRIASFLRNYLIIKRDKEFELTSEMKVLIASSYVKLTFGMRRYLTKTFDKIIIYPKAYHSPLTDQYHKGEYNPMLKAIVFSWEDFFLGDVITNDNVNLGIHEFSHALTFHGSESRDASARIFYRFYNQLSEYLKKEDNISIIKNSNYFRIYGFTNNLELIAVIMEHFFESPKELKDKFPKLYINMETMLNYKEIVNSLSD